MGESTAKGVQGVLFSAVLRGMAHTLSRLTTQPIDMVTLLNDLLSNDTMDQIFTLSYLILSPKTNKLSYIACGHGHLWHALAGKQEVKKLCADNFALGIDPHFTFEQITIPWHVGDTLLLHSFSIFDDGSSNKKNDGQLTEEEFKETFISNISLSPEKQVKALFRKLKHVSSQPLESRPLTMINIQRIS